jgi:type VI secretion system protein ImpE
MSASELFKAGRLQDAVQAQVAEVRDNPTDQGLRLFLFELLAFAGDLERARRQIEALGADDPRVQAGYHEYRQALDAEESRRRLFRDGLLPQFFAPPPEHARLRLEVVRCLREGKAAEALALAEQADAQTPELRGQLNGRDCPDLRDGDDRFGAVLEVLARGQYYWVPLEQVRSLTLNPPRFPRDLLYAPARLEMAEAAGDVFVPALYPGSHEHADEAVKLGRKTDWTSAEGEPVRGVGQRMFLLGEEAVPFLEVRQLRLG